MLAEGHDTRGIARKLNISVNTCRGYIKSLLARLGAHSQLQAVAIATSHGLVRARNPLRASDYPTSDPSDPKRAGGRRHPR